MKSLFIYRLVLVICLTISYSLSSYGQITVTIGTSNDSSSDFPLVSTQAPIPGLWFENYQGVALYPESILCDLDIPMGSSIKEVGFVLEDGGNFFLGSTEFRIALSNTTTTDLLNETNSFSSIFGSFNSNLTTTDIAPFTVDDQSTASFVLSTPFIYTGNGVLLATRYQGQNPNPNLPFPIWTSSPGIFIESGLSGSFVAANLRLTPISGEFEDNLLQFPNKRPIISLTYNPCIELSSVSLITASPTACSGGSAAISASTSTGSIVWYSDAKGQNQLSTGNVYNTPNLTSPTTYYFRAEDGACHSQLQSVSVGINANPSAPSASGATICSGETAQLIGSGSPGTYRWYSDGLGQNQLSANAIFTTPALSSTTSYFLAAVNSSGCESSLTQVTVTVDSDPNPPSAGGTTICLNETASLTAVGSGSSFRWYSDPAGQILVSTTANYTTPTLSNTTTYYASILNANNCESSLTPVTVTVETDVAEPVPTNTNIELCSGDQASLSAVSGGSNGTISWFSDALGNVQVASGNSFQTPAITSNTIYYVRETSPNNCESDLVAVSINLAAALSNPSAPNVTVCPGGDAVLSATSGGGNGTFSWTFTIPDVGVAALVGQTVTIPNVNDNLSISLTEMNGNCTSGTVTVNVTVDASIASPTAAGPTVCANETATLTAVSGGSTGSFEWFSDAAGSSMVSSDNPFITPALTANTSYFVKEVAGGCESDLVQVDVAVTTIDTPVSPDTVICSGTSIILNATGTGAINWYNDANQTTLLSPGATFFTGNLTATTTYFINQTENACTSELVPVIVTVNPIPADPVLTGATICSGETASLSAAGEMGATNQWFDDPFGMNLIFEGDVFTTGVLTATTSYSVRSVLEGCESDLVSVDAIVNSLPNAPTFASPSTEICLGDVATLTAISGGSNGTIDWFADAISEVPIFTGASFTTPALVNNTTYFVRETDANGCVSTSTTVEVTIADPLPSPQIFSTSICSGETASLLATTGGTNGSFVWFSDAAGDTQIFNGNPFVSPSLTTNTSYWLAETDGFCTSDLVKVDVIINPNPADPSVQPLTICSGEDATLTGVSGGSNGSLGWFSDPAATNQVASANPLLLTSLLADTTLYLVETLGNCTSNAIEVTVTVEPTPLDPSAMDVAICEGDTALLSAISGGANGSFTWFSDPAGIDMVATNTNLSVPNLNDDASFWLQETNGNCSSGLVRVDITVNDTPINPTGVGSNICEGESTTLTATSTVGTINWYEFADANGDTLAVGDTLVTEVLESTTAFFIQETTAAGCTSDFVQVTATVRPTPPLPTVATDVEEVCEDESAILSAMTIENAIYNWTGPNGFISNAQTPEINNASAANAGDYSVTATVEGCISPADTTTLIVNSKPTAAAGSVGSNSPLCEGTSLQLFAPTLSNVTYEWTFPNGTISNDQNPSVTNVVEEDDQGFYNLVITNNSTGCQSDVISTLVMIFDVPENIQAGNNGPVCEGESIRLTSSSFLGADYEWTNPSGNVFSTDQNPILNGVTIFDEGTYIVTITTEDGCEINQTGETIVEINANPTADAGPDQSFTEDLTALLAASGGVSYQWAQLENITNGNIPNPIFEAPIGSYTLNVTVFNEAGCSDTDSLVLTVLPQTELIIRDVFTPNGDGVNDTWQVDFIQNLSDYQLVVFNRAGFKVLESDAYMNNWDGTFEGNQLPDGTYWYVIRTVDREYKGAVTMKR